MEQLPVLHEASSVSTTNKDQRKARESVYDLKKLQLSSITERIIRDVGIKSNPNSTRATRCEDRNQILLKMLKKEPIWR